MISPRRFYGVCASLALAFGAVVALGAAPAAAANPVGYVILQGEGQCGLATVDLVTGATQEIGTETAAKCAFDLEFSPDGSRLFGTRIVNGEPDTAELVEFDLTTGAVTTLSQLGDFGVSSGPQGFQGSLTITQAGAMYTYLVPFMPDTTSTAVDPACDGSAFCLFQVDQTDPTNLAYVNHVPQDEAVYYGLATSCAGATTSAWQAIGPIAADNSSNQATSSAISDQTLTSVNLTATGPATTDIGVITDTFVSSLDYDSAGTLYGVGFATESQFPALFTLNGSTGAPTEVHNFTRDSEPISIGVLGFAIAHPCTPTPTPPPAPPTVTPAVVVTPHFTG